MGWYTTLKFVVAVGQMSYDRATCQCYRLAMRDVCAESLTTFSQYFYLHIFLVTYGTVTPQSHAQFLIPLGTESNQEFEH